MNTGIKIHYVDSEGKLQEGPVEGLTDEEFESAAQLSLKMSKLPGTDQVDFQRHSSMAWNTLYQLVKAVRSVNEAEHELAIKKALEAKAEFEKEGKDEKLDEVVVPPETVS